MTSERLVLLYKHHSNQGKKMRIKSFRYRAQKARGRRGKWGSRPTSIQRCGLGVLTFRGTLLDFVQGNSLKALSISIKGAIFVPTSHGSSV